MEARSHLAEILRRKRQAKADADKDRARVHAAADTISSIVRGHGLLLIEVEGGHYLSTMMPITIDEEPYVRFPYPLSFTQLRSSVEKAVAHPTAFRKLFGISRRTLELQSRMPELERAFNDLACEEVVRLESSAQPIRRELVALREATEKRVQLDDEIERKRRTAERRAFERARLAAVDEETRQVTAQYRDKVPFSERCVYCHEPITRGVNAHLDHIIPVSKGGLATEENLVWACSTCNLLKSDRSFHRFCKDAGLDAAAIVQRLHELGKFI